VKLRKQYLDWHGIKAKGMRGCPACLTLIKAEQMTEWIGGLGVDVKSAQLSGRTNYITR
jgi:hypothetical protein